MNTKFTAIAFRVAIFATLIAVIMAAGQLIYAFVETATDDIDDIEEYLFTELVQPLENSTSCYYFAFAGSIVALVLSVFARKHCSAVSVVMRTISIAASTVFLWLGMGVNHIFSFTAKFANELRGVKNLDELDPSDFGVSEWKWDSMNNALENEETAMIMYISAFIVAFLVFFVLMFTSIHYLTKRKDYGYSDAEMTNAMYVSDSAYTNEQEYEYYSQSQDDRYNQY